MQGQDRARFVAGLSQLAAIFRVEPTEPMFDGYWRALAADMDAETFDGVVEEALRESEFMPSAYELRQLARKVRGRREGRYLLPGTGWIDDPSAKRPLLPAVRPSHPRDAPPIPTYAECLQSCQENIDEAIQRAGRASDARYRAQMLADAEHWRGMRKWYEGQVRAGKGDERISMGGFSPPPGESHLRQHQRRSIGPRNANLGWRAER